MRTWRIRKHNANQYLGPNGVLPAEELAARGVTWADDGVRAYDVTDMHHDRSDLNEIGTEFEYDTYAEADAELTRRVQVAVDEGRFDGVDDRGMVYMREA